jgi:uncharacterized protein YecE (DUF72 family)
MAFHIGTSGWSYNHWQGLLYPLKTPVSKRLPYYLEKYDTVELNASFYRWPRDTTFAGWREKLPAGFLMTVKASRGLTHARALRDPEIWIERIEHGVRQLDDKLGVILAQLPPKLEFDETRLAEFLDRWPPDLKLAVEFRHPSWNEQEATFRLLERHGAAYCIMSGANLPCLRRATAPFVYVRFHGPDPHALYGGSYTDESLQWWADRCREWQAQSRHVWAYFNNDWEGNALRNADTLKRLLAG